MRLQAGLVASAHDLAEGGLAVALAESTFGSRFRCESKYNWRCGNSFI